MRALVWGLLGLLLLASMAGVGCNWGTVEKAEAAPDIFIDTFSTLADSFYLRLDAPAQITVDGDTTTYEIQSGGTLRFRVFGAPAEDTFTVQSGDLLVERPVAGLLTFVRNR